MALILVEFPNIIMALILGELPNIMPLILGELPNIMALILSYPILISLRFVFNSVYFIGQFKA